jgi:NADH:ubiquinone oxidoreductase subunit E
MERRTLDVLGEAGYLGEVFYGRTAQHLQSEKLPVPRKDWIGGVTFPPIISRETFDAARQKRTSRRRYFPRDDLLERLRNCRDEFGYLSAKVIEDCPYLPSVSAISRRFGSLPAAYVAAGLPHAIMVKGKLHRVRLRRQSKEAIVQGLRRLWDEKGFVTHKLINACDYLPHAHSIGQRFGGLLKAYEAAGLPYRLQEISRAAKFRSGLVAAGVGDKPPPRPTVRRNTDGSPFTDEQLVEFLRRLADEHGYLTERLIMLTPDIPKPSFFRTRFGTLEQAYAAAGWAASRSDFMRSAIARNRGGGLKPYEPWEDEIVPGCS